MLPWCAHLVKLPLLLDVGRDLPWLRAVDREAVSQRARRAGALGRSTERRTHGIIMQAAIKTIGENAKFEKKPLCRFAQASSIIEDQTHGCYERHSERSRRCSCFGVMAMHITARKRLHNVNRSNRRCVIHVPGTYSPLGYQPNLACGRTWRSTRHSCLSGLGPHKQRRITVTSRCCMSPAVLLSCVLMGAHILRSRG